MQPWEIHKNQTKKSVNQTEKKRKGKIEIKQKRVQEHGYALYFI